ncbi:MAG: type II toxin-antitoxin system RelE/ParE family toxin [Acidobacteriota bacterium]|nr:type II toxin-antitoxin system RelE/ParE family toxin [Acidobacteriota bacterium]
MIQEFTDKETKLLFETGPSRRLNATARVAVRKLVQPDTVTQLGQLDVPPGNRLEVLKGNRAGQYSTRINDQERICFRWEEDGVYEVEIVDYH